MKEHYSYNCPQGLMDGYETVLLDGICTWGKCFKGYGGCADRRPVFAECQLWNIPEIIGTIQKILAKKADARISLQTPNFFDPHKMTGEDRFQFQELLEVLTKTRPKAFLRVETTPRDLIYFLEERSDIVTPLLLRSAGIQEVWLGVESGIPELRNEYSKPPFDNSRLFKAMGKLKKAGIVCCWYLVVSPKDTDETIQITMDIASRAKPDRIFVSDLFPYNTRERYVNYEQVQRSLDKLLRNQDIMREFAEKIDREGWE